VIIGSVTSQRVS